MAQQSPTLGSLHETWTWASGTIGAAWVVTLGFYWDTLMSMEKVWDASRTFAHGYAVLPATLYLLWAGRLRLSDVRPVPHVSAGWAVLAVLGIGWLAGDVMGSVRLQQVMLVGMLPGIALTVAGAEGTRRMIFPLGFLFFMVPAGRAIEPMLQDFTAWFAVHGLTMIGVPVFWEGLYISVPGQRWEVAVDCAGLRYLLPGLSLAYLYMEVVYRSVQKRAVFLLAAIAVLVLANGLRATSIILFDYWGIAEGADHRLFSYTIYGVTMVPFLWLGLRGRDKHRVASSVVTPCSHGESIIVPDPQNAFEDDPGSKAEGENTSSSSVGMMRAAAMGVCILLAVRLAAATL